MFEDAPSPELREQIEEEGWLDVPDWVGEDDLYRGRNTTWIGRPGRMVYVDWDQVSSTPGNEFSSEKLATFADMIQDRSYDFVAGAPEAYLMRVDVDNIAESMAAEEEGNLEHGGMTRTFTTGDEELDAYLFSPERFLEHEGVELQDEMEQQKEEAIKNGDGDLGNIVAYLRDGNHRAFAAQLAGEPGLWVFVRTDAAQEKFLGLTKEDFE